MLEDHADAAARLTQFLAGAGAAAGQRREVLAGDGDRAGGGTFQEVDAADERGLAGAGLADDAVHLALADVQVDAVQGGDLAAAGAVDLGEARCGDHVGFRHCRVRGALVCAGHGGVVLRGSGTFGTRHGSRGGDARWRWDRGERVRGVARPRARSAGADRSGRSLRGARLRWCGGPLEGAHSTHTTSTGRHRRLGRRGAVARRAHAISKADVSSRPETAVRMLDNRGR